MSRRAKAALFSAAVFALGAVAGAAIDRAFVARSAVDLFDASARGSRHGSYVWSLDRKLGLSPEQRARIEAALARHDPEMREASAPCEARAGEVRKSIRAEVRAELGPDQQAEFDRLMQKHDAVRGRGPLGPGPMLKQGALSPSVSARGKPACRQARRSSAAAPEGAKRNEPG